MRVKKRRWRKVRLWRIVLKNSTVEAEADQPPFAAARQGRDRKAAQKSTLAARCRRTLRLSVGAGCRRTLRPPASNRVAVRAAARVAVKAAARVQARAAVARSDNIRFICSNRKEGGHRYGLSLLHSGASRRRLHEPAFKVARRPRHAIEASPGLATVSHVHAKVIGKVLLMQINDDHQFKPQLERSRSGSEHRRIHLWTRTGSSDRRSKSRAQ